jgi:hypothetical protein
MSRHWKIFILLVGAMSVAVVERQFVTMALITLFLPLYAWLLACIFLIGFIALACVVVPIGRYFLDRTESREIPQPPVVIHDEGESPRLAA